MMKEIARKVLLLFVLIYIVLSFSACGNGLTSQIVEKNLKGNIMLEEKNVGGLKESEVRKLIDSYTSRHNIEPKNASLDDNTWQLAQKEIIGTKVNIEKTLDALLKSNEGDRRKLVLEEIKPGITAEILKSNCSTIGIYTTPILDGQVSRLNNIEIASHKIDFKKLKPNEEFSFNNTVGKRTETKGYEDAPIIVKTEDGYKKGFGVGGGICQLSSTLYNAVEKAGLLITERHIHSKDIGYTPKGKDATVSYGSVDFKFRNNRSNSIMIRTYLNSKKLTVEIIENKNK